MLDYYDPRSITGRYGDPRPNGRIHEGIDFSHSTRPGTVDVPALLDGRVTAVWSPSTRHGYGHRIDVTSPSGDTISYAHLFERSPFGLGSTVRQGDVVGREGTSGWTAGPCCHVEHARNGRKTDPAPIITSTLATVAGLPARPITQEEEDMPIAILERRDSSKGKSLYDVKSGRCVRGISPDENSAFRRAQPSGAVVYITVSDAEYAERGGK